MTISLVVERASASVMVPFNKKPNGTVTPLDVMESVAFICMKYLAVPENDMPAPNVIAPFGDIELASELNVPVNPVKFKARQVTPDPIFPIVIVPAPLDPLKNTLSEAVGTEAPDAPPDEADQCEVSPVCHVPVPPTQYLEAMLRLG